MPVIHIEYDDAVVSDDDARALAVATQKIVADTTQIEDVFVYANTARIKIQVAPIEIFVFMSAHKIPNADALIQEMRTQLSAWKAETAFPTLVNLTLAPMPWKIELGI